jgi:ABC-type multidrug transport system permease subunit
MSRVGAALESSSRAPDNRQLKWSGQAGVQMRRGTFFTESYFLILLDLTCLIYLVVCAVYYQSVSSNFFAFYLCFLRILVSML